MIPFRVLEEYLRRCAYSGDDKFYVLVNEQGKKYADQFEKQDDDVGTDALMDPDMEMSSLPEMLGHEDMDTAGMEPEKKKVKLDSFPELQETNLLDRVQKYKDSCLTRKKGFKSAERRLLDDGVMDEARCLACIGLQSEGL